MIIQNNTSFKFLLGMMKAEVTLNVRFDTSRELHPRVWVESRGIAKFPFDLSRESYKGIMEYLERGKYETFECTCDDIITYPNPTDFQLNAMTFFIRKGYPLLYTPISRNYPYEISAYLPFLKGIIFFNVRRTKELIEYIREHDTTQTFIL